MRTLRIHPTSKGAASQKGSQTLLKILSAARDVFIENGYGEFNLKRVSERCGLARGNVTYYFPSRDDLLQALLQAVIGGYTWDFDHIMADEETSAEDKFVAIVRLIVEDLGTRETSIFFPELWALANRSGYAAVEMEQLYADARKYLVELIAEINPDLSPDEQQAVALFCSAALEGTDTLRRTRSGAPGDAFRRSPTSPRTRSWKRSAPWVGASSVRPSPPPRSRRLGNGAGRRRAPSLADAERDPLAEEQDQHEPVDERVHESPLGQPQQVNPGRDGRRVDQPVQGTPAAAQTALPTPCRRPRPAESTAPAPRNRR